MKKRSFLILLLACCCLVNQSFAAYPKLNEANHKFIDAQLTLFHNSSKSEKKQKSQTYANVANDAKILRNAYLWVYTWNKLNWKILNKESIENWIQYYNTLNDKRKNTTIESLKEVQNIAEELQRSFQIESEEDFEGYATTILPTPLYWLNKENVDINRIMWWEWTTWLLLDSANTIDQLGIVLPKWTPVTLIKEVKNWKFTYYEVRTRDFDVGYWESDWYFLDSRLVKKEESKPAEVIHTLPSMSEIYKTLIAAIDSQYIWWGSYYQGIPEMNDLYPTPSDVQLSTGEQQYKILQGTDCSGLLWQATNGYTPRNTRWLLTFWDSVAISWHTVNEITKMVKPLDLIVWAWHVIIILDNEHAIESIWKANFEWGVEIVDLKERLEDIFTRRQPVNEWSESELPDKEKFVIRRRFK